MLPPNRSRRCRLVSSGLVAGMLIATGVCTAIPMALALPHRHRAPAHVRYGVVLIFLTGLLVALLGIGVLLEVSA